METFDSQPPAYNPYYGGSAPTRPSPQAGTTMSSVYPSTALYPSLAPTVLPYTTNLPPIAPLQSTDTEYSSVINATYQLPPGYPPPQLNGQPVHLTSGNRYQTPAQNSHVPTNPFLHLPAGYPLVPARNEPQNPFDGFSNQLPRGYTPANYTDSWQKWTSPAPVTASYNPFLITTQSAVSSTGRTNQLPPGYSSIPLPGQLQSQPTYQTQPAQVASQQLQAALQSAVAAASTCTYTVPRVNFTAPSTTDGVVFEPLPKEVKTKRMVVQYISSADVYYRPVTQTTTTGWRSGIFVETNMFRKIDHKNTYLARVPGADYGRIEWRFDLGCSGRRLRKLKVRFAAKLYENGGAPVHVIAGNQRTVVNTTGEEQTFTHLKGLQSFSIVAELIGGRGKDAWQQVQLFRQAAGDGFSFFEVTLSLDKY